MRKFIALAGLLGLFTTSCQKQTTIEPDLNTSSKEVQQTQRPTCGMEEAMSQISPELKAGLRASANMTEAQAGELLIFLDFDGAQVRAGNPNSSGYFSTIISGIRNCPPAQLTQEQKEKVIAMVSDDFSPFNIIVTTDPVVFASYPFQNKQISIITTVPQVVGFSSGVGGVSPFLTVGFRLPSNPSFVFASLYGGDLENIAGTISHEVGHSMGLGHQHLFSEACNYLTEYHTGFGSGPLSFVPIMGDAATERIINWFAQSCLSPSFGVPQNDFALLNNQVVLREDDFANEPGDHGQSLEGDITGVLEQAGDVDFIRVNFKGPGAVTITSDNIDLKASIYNLGGQLMETYDDPGDIGLTIPRVMGNRYLKIEAVSNANMSSQFMTGQYKISY